MKPRSQGANRGDEGRDCGSTAVEGSGRGRGRSAEGKEVHT